MYVLNNLISKFKYSKGHNIIFMDPRLFDLLDYLYQTPTDKIQTDLTKSINISN